MITKASSIEINIICLIITELLMIYVTYQYNKGYAVCVMSDSGILIPNRNRKKVVYCSWDNFAYIYEYEILKGVILVFSDSSYDNPSELISLIKQKKSDIFYRDGTMILRICDGQEVLKAKEFIARKYTDGLIHLQERNEKVR